MEHHPWLWWIPFLPLLGSVTCGVLHYLTLRARRNDPDAPGFAALAGVVGVVAVGLSLVLAIRAFLLLRGLPIEERVLESSPWDWIAVGDLQITLSFLIDPLSSTMTLVVAGVGFLIHAYSTGYMKGDPGYAKFFSFMNLFVFAMLMLVGSNSLLGLFIGWEGVGLCSYLLIGFWYEKGWPAEAGQKAFVMNRIGDACFLIGSFLLIRLFGTLDISEIGALVPSLLTGPDEHGFQLALAALLLFGGCCGKSAQIPLFTWLPDAMAGPTPVSALIHAATMVTAGVYLVVRLNPLFAASPWVLAVIGTVGAVTALVGASTALVQRDIKKVLAYSTVSQLGYMFLGLGAGAFGAAIFHLVTHAFFKGLLFLAAGSVIHGMHEEQDMHKMGGLRRQMPRTFVTFLAGAAALSGLPLMSGYFSKDEILAHTFAAGGYYYLLWAVGIGGAMLTAFYTWRMVALTFFGTGRYDHAKVHPHESPFSMTGPLMVLALLSVGGGLLGLAPVLGHIVHLPHMLGDWLAPVTEPGELLLAQQHGPHGEVSHSLEWILLGVGAVIALVFAVRGFRAYREGIATDERLAERRPVLAGFLSDAWRVDSSYQSYVVLPLGRLARVTSALVDQLIVDGIVNGCATVARAIGSRTRRFADGDLRSYALWVGAGAVTISFMWIWS